VIAAFIENLKRMKDSRPLLALIDKQKGVITTGVLAALLIAGCSAPRGAVPNQAGPGRPVSGVTIVVAGEGDPLYVRSTPGAEGIGWPLRGSVSLEKTPILEWSWRVLSFSKSVRPGAGAGASLEDRAILLEVVAWFGPTFMSRAGAISYVWDSTAPPGTIVRKRYGNVYLVVRSGSADLGQWVSERRNVSEDFEAFFGQRPHDPVSIWVGAGSTSTRSGAELFVGPIAFRAP